MITFVRPLLLVIALFAWGSAAQAALVTYYYTGTVSIGGAVILAANSSIRAGDGVTGSFTLDTGVADELPTPERGRYSGFVSGTTTIGALTFSSTGGSYEVYDRDVTIPLVEDRVFLNASTVEVTGPGLTSLLEGYYAFVIAFQPGGAGVVSSDAPPDLVDFFAASGVGNVLGRMSFLSEGTSADLFFLLDSISLREPGNAVPEPGSLALMAIGLLGLAAQRWDANRRSPPAHRSGRSA